MARVINHAEPVDTEMIDGVVYAMSLPDTNHAKVTGCLYNIAMKHLRQRPPDVFFKIDVYASRCP